MVDGRKYDSDKSRVDLIPVESLLEIGRVLAFGARKYDENNWVHVAKGVDRYYAACLRHLFAWRSGEAHDPETGFHHVAHAACCLLFVLWFVLTGSENGQKEGEKS